MRQAVIYLLNIDDTYVIECYLPFCLLKVFNPDFGQVLIMLISAIECKKNEEIWD
jgi:hypothetical protein